ncbi:MAG: hypothetical protein L0215_00600 [Gemmataceae bacterium]|nr:hypothetical protein [Gemmataceae bacterium]
MSEQEYKPLTEAERLELANQLFREFYVQCFWHLKPDLQITNDFLPLVIRGLKNHGGRRGMLAADQLERQ